MSIKAPQLFLLVLLTFAGFQVSAQNKQAIVTYRAEIQQTYVDSFMVALKKKKEVSMLIKQQVAESYNNAQPEEFVLKINENESYYYEVEGLKVIEGRNAGSRAPISDFYTNSNSGLIVKFSRSLGKVKRKALDWDLSSGNTKEIGGYTCFKATATERLYSRQGFFYNREVIAWFTPEIPLHFGPSYYTGLPGLVIQVERNKFTITATEIILNPEDEVKITRVTEDDKMISEEEAYRRIGAIYKEQRSGN